VQLHQKTEFKTFLRFFLPVLVFQKYVWDGGWWSKTSCVKFFSLWRILEVPGCVWNFISRSFYEIGIRVYRQQSKTKSWDWCENAQKDRFPIHFHEIPNMFPHQKTSFLKNWDFSCIHKGRDSACSVVDICQFHQNGGW